jgi:hypothetical protein
MTDTIVEILIANKIFIYVVWTSMMFERTLGVYLFVNGFLWEKKKNVAVFFREATAGMYFVIVNGVMIYDLGIRKVEYQDFSYFLWFVCVVVLTYVVYKFVDKFQGRANKKKKRVRKVASI